MNSINNHSLTLSHSHTLSLLLWTATLPQLTETAATFTRLVRIELKKGLRLIYHSFNRLYRLVSKLLLDVLRLRTSPSEAAAGVVVA